MKDRWNQEFFWTLDHTSTWTQKERMLILDEDGSTVSTIILSGTTSTGTTF